MSEINQIMKAYQEAKQSRLSIVFFRTGNSYVVLFDDAELVGKILHEEVSVRDFDGVDVNYMSFQEDDLFTVVRKLNKSAIIPCTIIETQEFNF